MKQEKMKPNQKTRGEYQTAVLLTKQRRPMKRQRKESVKRIYKTAKGSMTENAKREYEDAKEKASKAAGDLGAKMRAGEEEL